MRHPLLPAVALVAVLSSTIMSASSRAAGPPAQPHAARIALGLRALGVTRSLLYVAAHPDDENTALLAYLANGQQVRTGYLSVTRGDGGQNLIGAEQGPALGLIRTQELLAARRVDGAEQYFTRARDFGFSKDPEETLRIWGKEAALADMVAVIRRFRPDVIVTRFSPEKTDTHGHHTASAALAVEAFRAAADPKFHPEQLVGGVEPWQASRILWNRSAWSIKPGEDLSGFFTVDVGGYDPLLGASFGEIAADSRSMHKSQGFGVARSREPHLEHFKVLANSSLANSAPAESPAPSPRSGPAKAGIKPGVSSEIFAGVELGWKRIAGAGRLGALVAAAARAFDPSAPHKTIPALLEIDRALDTVQDAPLRERKRRDVRDLVVACAGLFADATAADYRAAPGTEIEVTVAAINRSPAPITLETVRFPFGDAVAVHAPLSKPFELKRTVRLPPELAPSTPYWMEAPPGPGLYQVADPRLIGAPEADPPLRVEMVLGLPRDRTMTITRDVAFKWTDPVMGERYRPFEVTPAVSVRPGAGVLMFSGDGAKTLDVDLHAGVDRVAGQLRAEPPPGWIVEPPALPFALGVKGSAVRLTFKLRPGRGAAPGALRILAELAANQGGARLSRGVVRIEHPHIPIQTLLAEAEVRLVPIALATGGRRVGYVPGPGDEVPAALRGVGYDVTLLGDAALAAGLPALASFDAVVIGVRAFNTNERLRAAHAALMAYVEAGGTLVVQYNTNNRLAPLSAPLGPWPFEIGQHRVTDETAAVTFSPATHPVLTTPNRITAADFDGWIQERGLYFAETWDPRYQTPLAMHDPGEPPQSGAVVWARHGKGTFIYTGLAFFRQLPAGVPGAFRLFANLLAAGTPHGK